MNELFKKHYDFEIYETSFPLKEEELCVVKSWLPENLQSAASKRIDEFLAGRFSAVKASEKLGIALTALERAENRYPVWPKELVGSITHTANLAVSIVALSTNLKSIGIDIETIISEKRFDSIERMVLTDNDKAYISQVNGQDKAFVYTLVFSAKEALFKLINPLCRCYFDFREADIIDINFESNSIKLAIVSSRNEMKSFRKIYQGYFHFEDNIIYSYFALTY